MRRTLALLAVLSLFACEQTPGDAPPDLSDVSIADREIPPPPEVGFQIVTPVVTIPPGEEMFWCYYGTYDGPDVGVYKLTVHEDPNFSHHALLKEPLEVEDADRADGDLIDCSGLDEQFPPRPTLLESVSLGDVDDGHDDDGEHHDVDDWLEGKDWVSLPPEFAFKFDRGQRWLADIHFVNTTDEPVRTRAVFNLHTVPQPEVEHFVNTWNHDAGGFELPQGEETTLMFDCLWEHDVTILAIGGHMHSWGARYQVDHNGPQGMIRESAYTVDEWTTDMRYVPKVDLYEPGEFVVEAGESFRTWCTWDNDTDRSLAFPDEMCTTFGVGYPIEEAIYCIGNAAQNGPQ